MSRPTPARHRAACKPSTPLSAFGQAVAGPAGRRMAFVAASSGIVLTLTASASVAGGAPAPQIAPVQAANLTAAVVTDDAESLTVAPTVTVADDATFSFDGAEVSSEPPPPPPPPPPPAPVVAAPVATSVERPAAAAASRDNERDAAPQVEAAETAAPAASASGNAVVDIARRYIGTPYVYGGATPAGFDCSGFTSYVYAQAGLSIPRSSAQQRYAGTVVSAAEAQPGDLVWGPGHIGIYTGNGQHIAARNPSTALYESPIYIDNPIFIRIG